MKPEDDVLAGDPHTILIEQALWESRPMSLTSPYPRRS